MSPTPWSRRPALGLLTLGLALVGLATALVARAEAWGLVPAGMRGNPQGTFLFQVILGLGASMALGLLFAWQYSNRRSDRWASRHCEELAARQLTTIREVVLGYAQRRGRLPDTLEQAGLGERYLVNPWGRPYLYTVHDDRFTIITEMPVRLSDYFALEGKWLEGPGENALTWQ